MKEQLFFVDQNRLNHIIGNISLYLVYIKVIN